MAVVQGWAQGEVREAPGAQHFRGHSETCASTGSAPETERHLNASHTLASGTLSPTVVLGD